MWNNSFTVNHVNNVNNVLAQEFIGPIRGPRWLQLNRNDERSKSAQAINPRDQTERIKSSNKMGQSQSITTLTGTKVQIKLNSATKIGNYMLQPNYKDDEYLQKTKNVKNPTNGKIRNLDSPRRERFSSLSVDENDLLYIDDRLVIPKIL